MSKFRIILIALAISAFFLEMSYARNQVVETRPTHVPIYHTVDGVKSVYMQRVFYPDRVKGAESERTESKTHYEPYPIAEQTNSTERLEQFRAIIEELK